MYIYICIVIYGCCIPLQARDFLSKDANKGKAVEFRLSSCDDPASELQ